jgi:hypothetical protein
VGVAVSVFVGAGVFVGVRVAVRVGVGGAKRDVKQPDSNKIEVIVIGTKNLTMLFMISTIDLFHIQPLIMDRISSHVLIHYDHCPIG